MREMIRSLNTQQKQTFDEVYNVNIEILWQWRTLTLSVLYIRRRKFGQIVSYQYYIKTFSLYSGAPEKVKVLKMAPTGVVAVSINGTTIKTALGIPTTRGNNIPSLSDKMRCKLRLMYS